MEVSDIESVLKFLRKNGFSKAELALRNDLFERHDDLVASDFEKFQFPLSPKLPPVRIQRKLNFSDDDDDGGGDAASSSTSYLSEDFQSLSSSKGFTNPYGLLSTDLVSSDSSSDRLSQFGTARDYHDSDMLNEMFWHDEKGYIGGGGKDFFSCRSEDKFVTTSGGMGQYEQNCGLDFASRGFHSVTSINSGELLLRNNSSVDDADDVVVKDCYHWYEASQRGNDDEAGLESGAENNCLVPVYDSGIGLEGLLAGESDNDTNLKTMKELALIEGQFKTFGETPSAHDSTAGNTRNGSSPDKGLTKSDGEENQKEFGLQLQAAAQPFQPYGDAGYESEDGKEMTGEELHDPEVAGDGENSATPKELSIYEHVEDEYEVFNLRIIHRKNRTGFEENKDMPIVLNSVIAGRYYVTEYLGSAAFSKVIQAHDLQAGIDVCLKIIKNDKDFFDQSLDEIKLLKFVNKHDPGDEHHILRLYDYFYHQSITRQCLEALEYLHCLGIIHCDLKPENILIKSYSRCEIKVIDLGSSCFESDNLCLYIQSRSYRAPEVILGLPYDQKIDLWSLGCILAELCSGEVLFPNEALVVLLSRIIGMFGLPDMEMLVKGQETHKYFTKEYDLYHMNEETNQMECIIPEESSLEHHLQVSDIGFIEFVKDLLEVNPSRRPTASEALQHPWLSYPY
ncbi:hypothetical protein MKW92_006624 [Papaver armeniacum]|nr:hypothetical protein MKW92_006624 [Papaver armeniacum]